MSFISSFDLSSFSPSSLFAELSLSHLSSTPAVEFDPGCEGLIYTTEGLPIHGSFADSGDGQDSDGFRSRFELTFPSFAFGRFFLSSAIVGGTDGLRRVEYVLSEKARGSPHHIYIETCESIRNHLLLFSSRLSFFPFARLSR